MQVPEYSMQMKRLLAVVLFVLVACPALSKIAVEEVATIGEENTPEQVKNNNAKFISEVEWISGSLLLINGMHGAEEYIKVVRVPSGEVVWEKVLKEGAGSVTLTRDRLEVVVATGAFMPVQEEPSEGAGVGEEKESEEDEEGAAEGEVGVQAEHVIAFVLDANTGKQVREITHGDICEAVGRDIPSSSIDQVIAGHKKGTVVAFFNAAERDLARLRKQGDKDAVLLAGEGVYGIRGYLVDLERGRVLGKYKVDPRRVGIQVSTNGKMIGVYENDSFYVYDTSRDRDQVIAGKHKTEPGGEGFILDVPYYNGLQMSKTHVVVTKDTPMGHTQLIVVEMRTGKIPVNQNMKGDSHVFDVDFRRRHIAVTGSSKAMAIYDLQGKELAMVEGISEAVNHVVRFSPDGKQLAVVGELSVVQILRLRSR